MFVDAIEKILLCIVGIIFIGGGGLFVKQSMDANDLVESVLFGLLGIVFGLALLYFGIFGTAGLSNY